VCAGTMLHCCRSFYITSYILHLCSFLTVAMAVGPADELRNYRPIFDLTFLFNVIEPLVMGHMAQRLNDARSDARSPVYEEDCACMRCFDE